MLDGDVQYHIGLKKGDVGRYVLLPGDPGRVPLIASYFDHAEKIAANREFVTFTGEYQGVRVSVTSTGIGCPSTAICVEELHRVGAETLIRVGTSGSLQDFVLVGDLVIGTGAIRDDGTSRQYMPIEFPAVADFDVVMALRHAAKQRGYRNHVGIMHCKDAFYAESPEGLPTEQFWKNRWKAWERGNALCTEMESGTLFVLGSIKRMKVGDVVVAIGETKDGEVTLEKVSLENAILTALDAVVLLDSGDAI